MGEDRDNINIWVPAKVKENFYRALRKYQTLYPHGKVYEFLDNAIKEYEKTLTPNYPL